MANITVVSYCHNKHKHFIPFWAEQVSKQEFKDFDVLFIAHNWGEDTLKNREEILVEYAKLLPRDFPLCNGISKFAAHWGPLVIGDVIDFGCSRVRTEYFAHWDVDDIIHPKRLLLQSKFLDAHPEIDFLGTRMVGFNGEPTPEMLELDYYEEDEPNKDVTDHEDIRRVLLGEEPTNCLGHTTMIYRPEAMQAIGGFSRSDVKLDEKSPDFETWKKALMAGYKFHRLPQLCALWRLDSSVIRLL